MSDKILAAVSKGFIARMRFWAANRDLTTVRSSFPSDGVGGGGFGPRVPPLFGMVHDTEMAIAALPGRYAQSVRQFWLYEKNSLRWHGRHRQVNHETFEIWVMKGHELLKAEFATARERWRSQVVLADAEVERLPEPARGRVRAQRAKVRAERDGDSACASA